MRKIILCSGLFFLAGSFALGADAIFQHPAKIADLPLPRYKNVSCKFTQTKTISNSNVVINSGGNFKFDSASGVMFETLYPVQTRTTYTKEQNRRISSIITAISNNDYTYINKNFDVFYMQTIDSWKLTLKPKSTSKSESILQSLIIDGGNYINKITVNTAQNGSTNINFTECSHL